MKKFLALKNIKSFPEIIKSISYAVTFYFIVNSFNFYPVAITVYLSIAILFLSLAIPNFAIGLFVIALIFPLYALRVELLPLFIVPAIALGKFFNEKRGLFFVLLALSILGSFSSVGLMPLLLAVYFLGLGSAFLAVVSVLSIQTIGILLGKPFQGMFLSFGTESLLQAKLGITFEKLADFSLHWSHIKNFDFGFFTKIGAIFINNPALFIQPLIWLGISVIGAKLIKRTYKDVAVTYAGMVAATVASQLVLNGVAGGQLSFSLISVSGIWSYLFAMAITYPSLPLGSEIFEERIPEAVLVIDIVGSTKLGEKYGDNLAMKLKDRLDSIVEKIISKYDYRFKKGTGDGYFITFPSSNNAAKAALKILKTNNEENRKFIKDEQIELKMGMSFGEIIAKKNDRFGNAVNLAFRIQGAGASNMVDVSEAEIDLPVKNCLFSGESVIEDITNNNFDIKFLGYFEAKGLYGRHKLYDIREKAVKEPSDKPHFKVVKERAIEEQGDKPTITT
jgi:class 3 adenylate cyclase